MSYGYGQPQSYGYQQQDNNAYQSYNQGGFANGQMPGFNMNAPVIHMSAPSRPGLGSDRRGGGRQDNFDNRGRAGIGSDPRELERSRQQTRESMMAAQAPTREEIARTIFIGGLGEGTPSDEVLEEILKSVGKLRRWTRARDALDKSCRFGFAEYEDVDSLETAKAALEGGFEVPVYKDGKVVMEEGEEAGAKMMRVLVVIDDQSSKYIEDWMVKLSVSEEARQFRTEGAKEDFKQCITSLINGSAFAANANGNGDVAMTDVPDGETVEIQLNLDDDDLTDIPAEQRATVAEEIRAFRDRAKRLDFERVRKEDEIKAADSARNRPVNRLGSPPLNGAPSGPRIAGAPSGPKNYRGAQLPSDYADGVKFVSNGIAALDDDDDTDASDNEIWQRKVKRQEEEADKRFKKAEDHWLQREKHRHRATERDRVRAEAEENDFRRAREQMARRLEQWDDEEEDRLGREDFYVDRARWAAKRAGRRDKELRDDERDRQAEQEELNATQRHADEVRNAADQFLEQAGAEFAASKQSGPANTGFTVSLGGFSLKRNQPEEKGKRSLAEVAGFLDDEEDAAALGQRYPQRALAEANFEPVNGASLTEAERASMRQKLAADIPFDTAALFAWDVRWKYIEDSLIEREIRPFTTQKVFEYLGVQEDYLVDIIVNGLREHKPPQYLVKELEPVLDDEAEVFVKKLWRLVIYWAESESQGLN